jgi:hypothetical protein
MMPTRAEMPDVIKVVLVLGTFLGTLMLAAALMGGST